MSNRKVLATVGLVLLMGLVVIVRYARVSDRNLPWWAYLVGAVAVVAALAYSVKYESNGK